MCLSLFELVQIEARSDERVIEISPRVIMRLFPDKSVILYKDNEIEIDKIALSRDDIVAMEEATRTSL